MTTAESITTTLKRYPGPKPFTTAEQALFFGREKEREDLVRLVNAEKLVVLFGKSGLGKSSLLNAGLLPALTAQNKNWLPIPIRLRVSDGQNAPIQIVRQHLDKHDLMQITEGSFLADKTLWHSFKRHQQPAANLKYLLIFDQFEEFFTYTPEQQRTFRRELADLLYTAIPQKVIEEYQNESDEKQLFLAEPMDVRAMITVRSDRLHLLHQFKDFLPAILNARYELKGLTPQQARQAIELPARWGEPDRESPLGIAFSSPPFRYEVETVDFIVEKLSESQLLTDDPHVETVQLQLVCQNIEQGIVKGKFHSPVQKTDLPPFDDIFKNFYLQKVGELDPSVKEPSRRIMEEELISGQLGDETPRRVTVDQEKLIEALTKQKVSKENAEKLLNALVDTHLLRREPNSVGGVSYEICHDTFLRPMLRLKRDRENEGEKTKAMHQLKRLAAAAVLILALAVIASSFLTQWKSWEEEKAISKNTNTLYNHLMHKPPQYAAALHLADSLYTAQPTPQYAFLLTTAFYSYLNTGGYVYDQWTLPENPKNYASAFSADGQFLYLPLNNQNDTLALSLSNGNLSPTHTAVFDQRLFEDSTYSIDSQRFAKRLLSSTDCADQTQGLYNQIQLTHFKSNKTDVLNSPDGQIFELGFAKVNQNLVTLGYQNVKLWYTQNRILSILRGHEGNINTVVFSPDNRHILTASDDGTARIWSLDDETVHILRGHTSGVTAAIYTPDGKQIITISRDGLVKFWAVFDFSEKKTIDLKEKLAAIQFDKVGQLIVKPHEKPSILLRYEQGQWTKIGETKDAIPNDWGKATATQTGFEAKIEDSHKTIKIYDADDYIVAQLNAQELFSNVQFSSDGNSLIAADGQDIIRVPMPSEIHKWLKTTGFRR